MKEVILNLSKKQKIILSIISISLLVILCIYCINKIDTCENSDELIFSNNINTIESYQEEEKEKIEENTEKVVIHIIGEVNNPGVVTLNEGARIIDAINAAGGKTEEADLSKINLAYVVEDGTQIYIPRINENINQIELITSEAGKEIILEGSQIEQQKTNIKVNINTSNKEKLMTLPGIGETTAQKIIEYREQNGKFKSIEDIQNVSGIGEAKYNSLKDKITV